VISKFVTSVRTCNYKVNGKHRWPYMPFLAINPVIEPIGRVGLNKAQLSQLQKKPKRPIYKEAIFSKWDCQDALQSQGWASCQTGFSLTLSVALHCKFFTPWKLQGLGITGSLQGKPALSMEKGRKNHKKNLCMLWINPVIFTDCGETPW
jgi:hypothetical protein